jgi:hypothetical protein
MLSGNKKFRDETDFWIPIVPAECSYAECRGDL